ncbi:MAG: cobalamin biosynthesis protein CobW [Oscillospiraceae bacterium]|nr:cobalamin biosynthesis protein CobW [Oscillospiraceae bacterium]
MTTVDIFSGFLGAGKTTLIKKLIKESFKGKRVVLIENEFGEIGIDGSFLKESGIKINELNDGCICCSLVGDFRSALREVIEKYEPELILIEPSGVGKLSDVTRAVEGVADEFPIELRSFVAVADAKKVRMYMKNFGEFYDDQISHASAIVLSRTKGMDEDKLAAAVALIRAKNPTASIVTTDWDLISGDQILEVMHGGSDFVSELRELARKANEERAEEDDEHEHHHHHHHHDDDGGEDEHEHHHHHHHDGEECDDPECECHHHHDGEHHHHHHHADEVFSSIGFETAKSYTMDQINEILTKLDDNETYGIILRSKGMVYNKDGGFIYFDYVPEEKNVRPGSPEVTGKVVVIGSKLNEEKIKELF